MSEYFLRSEISNLKTIFEKRFAGNSIKKEILKLVLNFNTF